MACVHWRRVRWWNCGGKWSGTGERWLVFERSLQLAAKRNKCTSATNCMEHLRFACSLRQSSLHRSDRWRRRDAGVKLQTQMTPSTGEGRQSGTEVRVVARVSCESFAHKAARKTSRKKSQFISFHFAPSARLHRASAKLHPLPLLLRLRFLFEAQQVADSLCLAHFFSSALFCQNCVPPPLLARGQRSIGGFRTQHLSSH